MDRIGDIDCGWVELWNRHHRMRRTVGQERCACHTARMPRAHMDKVGRGAFESFIVLVVFLSIAGCARPQQVQATSTPAPSVPEHTDTPTVLIEPESEPDPADEEATQTSTQPPTVSTDRSSSTPAAPAITFTRYPDDVANSPITVHVAEQLRNIRAHNPERLDDVFIKVGSSETVDARFLRCFGGGERSPFVVEFGNATHLEETLEFFRQGKAGGRRNSFVRTSEAAKVGRTTSWAYRGGPSPLKREIRATNPGWAVIAFGTNDLNHGTTPQTALWPYYKHLSRLVDQVTDAGVIPIIIGPGARTDSKVATRWNEVFDIVTRAVAEKRQVPYVNFRLASINLPGKGLIADGIHGNVYADRRRGRQPCIFTEEALQFQYNVRNLLSLEALDRGRRALLGEPEELQVPPLPDVVGDGSIDSPFVVDRLPFIHAADTSESGSDRFDRYPECDGEIDMSGPELLYRFEIEEDQRVRILVLTANGVDVDVQLLGSEPTPESCRDRHGMLLQGSLSAGTYHVAVDTFVGRRGTTQPGPYQLVIMACSADDRECSRPIE